MSTLFTRIIDGEIPGRFVWKDDEAVVFLTIAPMARGHAMVVPREKVDHWLDLSPDLAAHLVKVAQVVGQAQMEAFAPKRVGLLVAGLEVPHVHLHVVPINSESDLNFAKADHSPDPAALDGAAERLREALRAQGHGEHVPNA
jgi:diadenosine tetraphosphate (Ap4A) HIT family hydrolase